MTRGVTALVHGDVTGSLILNPGALLLVVAVAVFLGYALVQWKRRVPVVRTASVRIGSVGATFAGLWGWQLFKYSTGRAL